MAEFLMPSLGADMESAKLTEWLVPAGASVKHGDVVAVVETQKGAIEIEIFQDGVIERQLASPGQVVPVGAPLALIRIPGETEVSAAPLQERPEPPAAPTATSPPPAAAEGPPSGTRASPAAKRLAQERGIDLASVAGSGPLGAIVLADVEAVEAAGARAAKATAGPALEQMRSAIAAAMARSKREIPHYYLSHSIDAAKAAEWLNEENAKRPPQSRLLLAALLVKATALAAKRFPEVNGFHVDGRHRPSEAVHVGVAIAMRGGGLAAPAIHDTSELDLDALMARLRDLVERVRAGRFRSSEIADPTITVSNLGDRGVETLFGVIYPPQVALVGFGKVVERPWSIAGEISSRPSLTVSLAADHRVSDGHRGALFLAEIDRLLQSPEAL